jgi:hypothetical protein
MIYLVIAILLFFNYIYIYSKNSILKISNYFVIFMYIFFIGFAYFNFTDSYNYFTFFKYKIYSIDKGIYPLTTFEPLFVYYSMFVKYFTNDFLIYQAITFTFEFFVIHFSLKKLFTFLNDIEFVYLKIILFFPFITLLLPAFRQSFAITIFIFSLTLLIDKKYIFFIIINLIGVLFHTSLIFCLPLYFIIFNNYFLQNKFILFLLLILGFFSIFFNFSFNFIYDIFQNPIFNKYTFRYTLLSDFHLKIGFFKKIELIILFYFIIIYNYSSEFKIQKSLFLFYFIFNMFFSGIIAHRIIMYFEIFYYISIFLLFYDIANKRVYNPYSRLFILPLSYILCLYLFKFINIFNPSINGYFFPYNNYFF